MRRPWAYIHLSFGVLIPAACGTASELPEPALPEGELAQRFAEAICDRRLACDCYDPLTGPVGEDPETATRAQCVESRRLEIEHWQQQVVGHLRYDGACALRRLEQLPSMGCLDEGHLEAAALATDAQRCERPCSVYHGLGARGQSCDEGEGCLQGLVCDGRYDPQSWEYRRICGDPCRDFGEPCGLRHCGAEERCDPVDETCRPLPGTGELCDYACRAPDHCGPDGQGSWRCGPAGENGAPCSEVPTCLGTCVEGICAPGPARICDWDLPSNG